MSEEFLASDGYASSHQSSSINLQKYDYIQDATSKGFSVTYKKKGKLISKDPITGITKIAEGGFVLSIETPDALVLKQQHERAMLQLILDHNNILKALNEDFDFKMNRMVEETRSELQRLEQRKQEILKILKGDHNYRIYQENYQYNNAVALIDRQREEAINKHGNKLELLNQEKDAKMNNVRLEFQNQVQQIVREHENILKGLGDEENEARRQEKAANNSLQQIKAQQARALQEAQQLYGEKKCSIF